MASSYIFYFLSSMDIKNSPQVSAEGKLYSASIHPNSNDTEKCFVAGGEDFKLYKYSLEDGREIGRYGYMQCSLESANCM